MISPTTEPWKLVGAFNVQLHHRLEQNRFGFREGLPETALSAGLESPVTTVHFVVRTVLQDRFQAHDRELGERAFRQVIAKTAFDRGYVLLGDASAHHVLFEFEVGLAIVRQQFEPTDDVSILAGSAGLFLVFVVEFGHLCRRFTVTDFRSADFHLHLVLAPNALDIDFQM